MCSFGRHLLLLACALAGCHLVNKERFGYHFALEALCPLVPNSQRFLPHGIFWFEGGPASTIQMTGRHLLDLVQIRHKWLQVHPAEWHCTIHSYYTIIDVINKPILLAGDQIPTLGDDK